MGANQVKKTSKWIDSPLNKNIRELLEIRKISTNELAEHLSISAEAVRQWTAGYARPDVDKVVQIADFFKVSSDFLLGITTYMNKKYQELTVSDAGLSEAAAKKIYELANIGGDSRNANYNELPFRVEMLHILNSIIEHKDFGKLLSQIELYKRFACANANRADDEVTPDDICKATEIIKRAGDVVVNPDMVSQSCFMRATIHFQHITESISSQLWTDELDPLISHTEQ